MKSGLKMGGVFVADCYDRHGNLKWSATAPNIVTNEGLQHALDLLLTNSTTPIATWYIGLMATTGVLAADVASTHTFTEASEYNNAGDTGDRPAFVEGRTAQSVSNTGNLASFAIDKDGTTIEGAFLISSESIAGSAGILLSGGDFTGGVKVGDSGDSLRVTYTFTAADDGV